MKRPALRVFFLVLLLSSHRLHADTLVGQNGDRIAGRLIEEKNGKIVFDSELFGRLELASDKARVELGQAGANSPSEVGAVVESAPAKVAKPHQWSADVGIKLNMDRGSLNTSEDRLDARAALERKSNRGEFHGSFDYKYKSTEDELRDDDWLASLSYDRFLSERRFNAGRLTIRNEYTDADHDVTKTLSLATGWRLWETPEHYLRVGPALGYLTISRGDQTFDGAAVGVYARGLTPLVWRSQLTGELQYLDTLGSGRLGNLQLRIRHPLTERIFVSVGWDYAWNDSDVESGITSAWRRDMGWRFGPAEND